VAAIVTFSSEGRGFERVVSWKQDVNNNVGQIPCFLFVTQVFFNRNTISIK